MSTAPRGTVLVSGASIAGPALAYWLHRHGFTVTVVEKAAAVRGGGYPIDIRGTALGVVERMGLLPEVRAAHVDSRRMTFLGASGTPVATLGPEALTGGVEGRDVELPRGDLTGLLYGAARDDVEFVFGDAIAALDEDADGVDVTFARGGHRRFDLVVGADGLHSGTRAFAFGPEEQFHRYLGYCFAGWTMPNEFGLSHEAVTWSVPGRAAVIYAVGDATEVHGFLSFIRDDPSFGARDPRAQRDLVAARYADDDVWEVPRLVAAMRAADDVFFDVVSQIRMPRWSAGRVGLVGDAAHAPSFLSGQGSSLALVGAYVLAGELAEAPTYREGFERYERRLRDFVAQNQALADGGRTVIVPRTEEDIAARDAALQHPEGLLGGEGRPAYTALELPDYPTLTSSAGRR